MPLYVHIIPTSGLVLTWPVGRTRFAVGITFVHGTAPDPNVESVVLANSADSTDATVTLVAWVKVAAAYPSVARPPITIAKISIPINFFILFTSFFLN